MKVYTPDLANTEMEADEYKSLPDVEIGFGQTLARLIGFDRVSNIFRFLKVSNNGSLRVTPMPEANYQTASRTYAVTTAVAQVVPANPNRHLLILKNTNTVLVFVTFGGAAVAPQALSLGMNDILMVDNYAGALTLSSSAGSANVTANEISTY